MKLDITQRERDLLEWAKTGPQEANIRYQTAMDALDIIESLKSNYHMLPDMERRITIQKSYWIEDLQEIERLKNK